MMRLRTLFCSLLASFAVGAFAQFGGQKMPDMDYMPALLMNPAVVKDMHVSPDVSQKVMNVMMQEGMKMMGSMGKGGMTSPQGRDAAMQAMKDMQTKCIAPLNPAQRARLHELTLQFLGPSALMQPSVVKSLHLSSSQESRISGAISAAYSNVYSGFKMPNTNGAHAAPNAQNMQGMMANLKEMGKKQKAARATSERAIDKILTPAQRAKWTAMQGRKMADLSILPGMGGGGMFGGM